MLCLWLLLIIILLQTKFLVLDIIQLDHVLVQKGCLIVLL
jgi:hypothetical protein